MSEQATGTPPLTNRGCLTPNGDPEPVLFHLDYLKLTVFADLETVRYIVERALLEPAGLEAEWVDKGQAMRWGQMLEGPGPVYLLVPKDLQTVYTMVEMRGTGCTTMGPEVLQGFLAYLRDEPQLRWRGKRIDLAFDHVQFSPRMVFDAIERDDLNSRCLRVADKDWNENIEGRTAYLGRRDAMNKPRRLRVYDKRSYNRFEAEFRDLWADKVTQKLAGEPLTAWADLALGYVRSMVDFVDHTADPRRERCPLLPWWDQFVGHVSKFRSVDAGDQAKQQLELAYTAIGKSEATIKRIARAAWPIIEALGEQYFLDRIRYYCKDRITDADRQRAKDLERYKYTEFAGLGGYHLPSSIRADEEIPI